MFKSKSIGGHLLRGLSGFGFLALALSGRLSLWAAIPLGVGGVFLLRGCPMCWTVGLIETVLAKTGAPKPPGLTSRIPVNPQRGPSSDRH